MNINDLLFENLGTLHQLNVGPLINVLKQGGGYRIKGRHGRSYLNTDEIGRKFAKNTISNTSVITDPILLKQGQGFKSLRKAFLDLGKGAYTPVAFALYIDNQAIAFGTFDYEDLRGSSRTGMFAYDLTPVADIINQIDDEEYDKLPKYSYSRNNPRNPSDISSYHEKPRSTYSFNRDNETENSLSPQRYQGKTISTNDLGLFISKIENVTARTGAKLFARLVMADKIGNEKRKNRNNFSFKQFVDAGEDLKRRLAIYKNSKKPTVDTIEKFIAYSLSHPGKNLQFAGRTYKLTAESYDKISPIHLLAGQTFTTRYSCVDPSSYESLELTYRFDQQSNQLIPIKARWSDGRTKKSQTAVLNAKGFVKATLGNKELDKETVIKLLLEKMKNSYYTEVMNLSKALLDSGYNWPELKSIYNSVKFEFDNGKGI